MEVIEKLLFDLQLATNTQDASVDPSLLIQNIEAQFLEESQKEYCIALLLQSESPPSLLSFLSDNLRSKDRRIVKAKLYALKFLAVFIKQLQSQLINYAFLIYDSLLDLFKKVESNEIKAHTIFPLKNLFRHNIYLSVLGPEDIKLDITYKLLIDHYLHQKPSKGLRGEILKLLGLLVSSYPDDLPTISAIDKILDVCFYSLKNNFNSNNEPELPVIAGAFSCIDRCIFHFEERFVDNHIIWKYLLQSMLAVSQENIHRFIITSKALRLLKHHAGMFQTLIGLNPDVVYHAISLCYHSEKKVLQKHAESAIILILKEISNYTIQNPDSDSTYSLITSLKKEFSSYLDQPTTPESDIVLAVRGFAAMAPALSIIDSKVNTKADVKDNSVIIVLNLLIASCRQIVGAMTGTSISKDDDDHTSPNNITILKKKSEFLFACASILHTSNSMNLPDDIMDYLCTTSVELILGYSRLWIKYQPLIPRALCLLLQALRLNIVLFHQYTTIIIPCLILRTIGRRNINEHVEVMPIDPLTGEPDTRLFPLYIPLWDEILTPEDKETKLIIIMSEPSYSTVVSVDIYDSMLRNVIESIKKLQLSYITIDDEILPDNLVDQEMLLNMVSFLEKVIPKNLSIRLILWMPMIIEVLISLSIKYPLVSAFYRLINCLTSTVQKLNYFEEPYQFNVQVPSGVLSKYQQERIITVNKIKSYLSDVSHKLGTFNNHELLSQALSLIINTSSSIVTIPILIDCIYISLRSGLEVNISVRKLTQLSQSELAPHLSTLLPLLRPYLSVFGTHSKNGDRFGQTSATVAANLSTSFTGIGFSKSATKRKDTTGNKNESDSNDENCSRDIAFNILRFLGMLGGLNKGILCDPVDTLKESSSLGKVALLNVAVPLPVISYENTGSSSTLSMVSSKEININISDILLRLISLCKHGEDKQLRILSAEILHYIIVMLIGKSAIGRSVKQSVSKSDFAEIYSLLFPTAIFLAACGEAVTRRLFETLLWQIIHWFSGHGQVHTDDCDALLETLFIQLSDSSTASIRTLAAAGLEEFFQWSIKQATKNDLTQLSSATGSLISRLLQSVIHPNGNKRNGAIAALNKLYRSFREETALINLFSLQILFRSCESLLLSDPLNPNQDCIDAAKHYSEIIFKSIVQYGDRAKLLSTSTERTFFPRTLADLLLWLWDQLAHPHTPFRRTCMQSFSLLCPAEKMLRHTTTIDDTSTLQIISEQVMYFLETHNISYLKSFEASLIDSPVISLSVNHQKTWLTELSAALDCFSWLIRMKFLSSSKLLQDDGEHESNYSVTSKDTIQGKSKGGTSSSTSRKRKASTMSQSVDEPTSENSIITYQRKEGKSPSLLMKYVSEFFRYCNSLTEQSASSDQNNQLLAHQRIEVLRRIVQLLTNILDSSSHHPSAEQSVSVQVINTFLSQNVMGIILHGLLSPAIGHGLFINIDTSSINSNASYNMELEVYLPASIEKLLELQYSLGLKIGYKGVDSIDCLKNRILQQLEIADKLDFFSLQCLHRAINIIKTSSYHNHIFVSNISSSNVMEAENIMLVQRAKALFQLVFGISLSNVEVDDSREKLLLDIAFDIGLPIVTVSEEEVSNITRTGPRSVFDYIRTCSDKNILDAFLCRYEEKIVTKIIEGGVSGFTKLGPTLIKQALANESIYRIFLKMLATVDSDLKNNTDLINAIVSYCHDVDDAALLERSQVFELVLALDASLISTSSNMCLHKYALDSILSKLQDPNSPVESVIRNLNLLPYVLGGVTANCPRPLAQFPVDAFEEQRVVTALEDMVADRFPLDSQRLDPTTNHGKIYSEIFRAYLDSIACCGSICLFGPLLPSIREGRSHRYIDWIDALISRLDESLRIDNEDVEHDNLENISQRSEEVSLLCHYCIKLMLDKYHAIEVKSFFRELCLRVLANFTPESLVRFFTSSNDSMSFGTITVSSSSSTSSAALVTRLLNVISVPVTVATKFSSNEDADSTLYMYSVAYDLLGVLFDRCFLASIKGPVTIASHGLSSSGKELTQAICRAAHKQVRSDMSELPSVNIIQRLYSSAYNCLLLVVAKTQSDEKFFDSFLFVEKSGETFWTHIIDCTQNYSFSINNETGIKTVFLGTGESQIKSSQRHSNRYRGTSSRSQLNSRYLTSSALVSQSSLNPMMSSQSQLLSSHSMSSQHHHSLSQRVAELESLELTFPSQKYVLDTVTDTTIKDQVMDMDVAHSNQAVKGLDDYSIAIEMNDVNQQPCMGTLLRVLQRMAVLFSNAWENQAAVMDIMPKWLTECRDRLVNYSPQDAAKRRIMRLFMLRLLINQPVVAIVTPWAQDLFLPVIECCNHDLCDVSVGSGYHYFLRDVVFTFCESWSQVRPKSHSEIEPSCRLLSNLIGLAYMEESSKLSENKRSIIALLRLWLSDSNKGDDLTPSLIRNYGRLDLNELSGYLGAAAGPTGGAHAKSTSKGTESVKQRLYALDILETLLLSGYKLFTRGINGQADRILELLIEGVKFPRKEVFERSASISGLVLSVLAKESALPDLLVPNTKDFRDKLESRLSSKIMQVDGLEGVAACLRAISEYSPDFITRELLVKMLSVFSKLQAKGKIALLEVLYRMTSSRFENISVVNSLRPFIISCLADLSSVAFGRGVSAVRLPMVQINMLLLLTQHQEDLELPIIQLLLGKSAVEGLALVTSTKSVLRTREVAYDLLMGLYNKNKYLKSDDVENAESSTSSALTVSLRKGICILLLRGLSDPDDAGIDDITCNSSFNTTEKTSTTTSISFPIKGQKFGRIGIRRKVFDFFNAYIGLSADPGKRLLGLMTELFDVSQSGAWLHYCTYLLLCLPKQTKDFRLPLFVHTLSSDTVFAPMKLVGDRLEDRPSNPMTPLFSLDRISQLSQSQFSQHSGLASALSWGGTQSVDRSGPRGAMLRGTQQVHWTQTQDIAGEVGGESPVDGDDGRSKGWISEMSTQKAYQDHLAAKTARLHYDGMPPPSKLPSRLSADNKVIVQKVPVRYGSAGAGATTGGSGYATTGKTFYQTSQQAQNKRDLAQARNAAKVVVYRQYRSGELPDISITPADLLLPLQRLCLLDSVIASTVFSSIFEGLYTTATRSTTSIDEDWKLQVQIALKQMLSDSLSVDCNNQFVSTVLSSCQACVDSFSEPLRSQSGVVSSSKKSSESDESRIDSKLVAEVALQSLNFHSGIQLLEMSIVGNTKKIMKLQEKDNNKRKRQSAMITQGDHLELRRLQNENTRTLLQLIRLYSGLGEYDVLVGLVTRFNASNESRKALDCEQQGDYSRALKQYNILIQNLSTLSEDIDVQDVDRVSREEEYWQDKSLDCMRQLMHWEELYDNCKSLSKHPEGVLGRLSDDSVKGRLLPHFLKSICNLGDEGRETDSTNECLTRLLQSEDTELKRWVEGRFAPDFSCCFLYVEDWTKSKYYAEKSYDQFLSKWSSLHPCAFSARHQLLQGIQRVVEIEEWATLKRENILDKSIAFQRWSSSDPAKSDPIWMWNDVARVRQLILMSNNNADSSSSSSSSRYNSRALQMLSNFHIKMAGAAVSQGNLDVVKPMLTISSSLRRQEGGGPSSSSSSMITMDEVRVGYQYHKMKIKRTSASDSKKITEIFTNTLNLLNTKLTSTGNKEVVDLYHLYQMRAEWYGQWGGLEYQSNGQRNKLLLAMEDYQTALSHAMTANAVDHMSVGVSYGNLASYCDKLLELGCFPENEISKISHMVIENYMKGIIHGDKFCRSKLLRIFRLAGEHPEMYLYLEENLLSVPAWIYLKYSAQLMSCLDRPEGMIVIKVLEYVAMKYPEALYFPFTSTIECLGSSGKSLAKQNLERLLHNQNLDSFVEALTGLTHPEHRFVDGLKSLEGLVRGNKINEAKAAYCNLRSYTLMNEWNHVGDKIGSYNSKWANKIRKELDREVGPNGEKLNQPKDYGKLMAKARELVSSIPHRNTAKIPLSEFSDWLSDTNFSKVRIEIPGQYSNFGDCHNEPPDISQHITIASVSGSLLVMSSIRKPKRITLIGSDGKEYMFLVKGGEDLRNDERVETLFMMMNTIICQSTGLYARTFTVIPMTPRVGILEWVSDTIPLKSVIGDEMERDLDFCAANPIPVDSAGSHIDYLKATELRDEWLRVNDDNSDVYDVFRNCKDASDVWQKMLQLTPDDFIRKYLLNQSTSAETFLTLRSEFAKSLAISNIFGYVLGLGDRHLENLLVDKKCGSIVQIDFGVCFGIGTSILGLPEMIPFRLTPQLIGSLQPLDGIGLLRHYMVECFLALRSDQGVALMSNALDIYVNDPILDWIKGHEYDKDEAVTNAKHATTMEISRKVGNTLKKLRGVHPVQILIDDLEQNVSIKKMKVKDAAINILSISSEEYRVPPNKEIVLDVSDQIDCLIYLATDPNILIRQYIGLRTWL